MTIAEAIEILERVDICANAAETARDMAIAALKEQNVTDINVGNKTNADRIRAMSDEELVRVLSSPCLGCVVKGCKLHNYGSYGCENAFLKWLQQPAEEDAG